jgi:hypothetical protein
MTTMRRSTVIVASVSLLLATVFIPANASAQYYRRYHREDVEHAVRQAEATSNEFVRLFDHELDRSVLNGSEREDQLNEKAKDLARKLDKLDHEFHERPNWWEAHDTAADALYYAKGINNSVNARHYSPTCEHMWARMRADLNAVACYYNLPQLHH